MNNFKTERHGHKSFSEQMYIRLEQPPKNIKQNETYFNITNKLNTIHFIVKSKYFNETLFPDSFYVVVT